MNFAREQDIAAALAKQWSCPLLKILPSRLAECAIPFHLLQKFRIVPVHFTDPARALHLAFAEDIHYHVLFAIEQMLGSKTEACLTTRRELESALSRLEERRQPIGTFFEGKSEPEEMTRITSSYTAKLDATDVQVVLCGEIFWIRTHGTEHSADLLFLQRAAGVSNFAAEEILERTAG